MAELKIVLVNGDLAGKTAQSIAKEVNAAALAAKKAEIGTKEWVAAHERLDKAKGLQADLKKQIDSTTTASNQLKQAWNMLPGATYFNQIGDSIGLAKSGVGGLVSQFGVLKTAIISTGIGVFVVAVGTLYAWIKKTDEGATLFAGTMKGLEIIGDKVFGRLVDGAKYLGEFFTGKRSIKQGLQDLLDFLKGQVTNRIAALGLIWEGIVNLDMKTFLNGTAQMATGVENVVDKFEALGREVAEAVEEGIELEKQLDAIEDRARELSVLNAETEKEVGRLLLQSKNVALTYDERIALLDKASKLELKAHQQALVNARELEAVRQREIDKAAERNIATDELDQALADATIARINLEKESINLQEKIENRRTALLEKRQAEIEKQAQDELRVRQNIRDLEVAAMAEGMDKEIAQIQVDTERKIEALVGTAEQITLQKELLEDQEQMRIQTIRDKYAAEQAEKDKKHKEEQAARDQKALEEKLRIEEAHRETAMMRLQAESEMASGVAGFGTELLARQQKDQQTAKKIRKVGAVADIGINMNKELSAISMNAAANPLNAVPGGAAIVSAQAAILRTMAKVRAAIGVASVIAFRRGGVLRGPSHENGGIDFTVNGRPGFNAEGDEILMTRGVYRNPALRSMASAINVAGGGVAFAAGGPIDPFSSSSGRSTPVTSSTSSPGADPFEMMAQLGEKFEAYAAKVDRWARELKVYNDVTKTMEGIDTINRIKDETDV